MQLQKLNNKRELVNTISFFDNVACDTFVTLAGYLVPFLSLITTNNNLCQYLH